ncbi:MAG: hypothetical protein ACKPEA_07235, partial [Planctomycetota bacterium]
MRFPRILRRIIWPLTALLVLVASLWLWLLSPPALTRLAEWALSRATGVPVEVTHARWNGWNRIEVDRVLVSVPGWEGDAGRLLQLDDFRSVFRPLDLLIGRLTVEDLQVREASLCLAQRPTADGGVEFNLSALAPSSGGFGPSVVLRPSHVDLGLFRVQYRSLSTDRDVLGRNSTPEDVVNRAFRATMERKPMAGPHELSFELFEVDPTLRDEAGAPVPRTAGLGIDGTWNDVTFAYEMSVREIDFGRSIRPLLPLVYGKGWDRLGVKGKVTDLHLRGDLRNPIREGSFRLSDAAVNLGDFGLKGDWWRFREGRIEEAAGVPRMAVDRGTVIFRDNRLTLQDFAGKLLSVAPPEMMGPFLNEPPAVGVPLPAELTLSLDFTQTPPSASLDQAESWFRDAVDHAGVDLRARVPDLTLRSSRAGEAWSVELPRVVVNILENFRVRQGSIAIDALASRAPSPVGTETPPTHVKGSLTIREGQGAYVNFPYPLTGVEANIEFEDDQVRVRRLKAAGSAGCAIEITGAVDGTDDDAGVDLRVQTVTPAPIDEALQNAFQPGPRRIFELLFARSMREQLVQAGLLPDRGTELGGTCLFDIQVRRPRRGGDHVETTGTIRVNDARVLCSRFPYPIDVQEGFIQLEDERILLPAGRWRFTTAGGGEGRIEGEVRIPRSAGGRDASPDLRIFTEHDRINPLLLAALPPDSWKDGGRTADGWPGRRRSEIAEAMQ